MLDSDAFINWEGRKFDLVSYLRSRASENVGVSAIVWQQLWFGAELFEAARSAKRRRFLSSLYPAVKVIPFDVSQAREAAAALCCNAELLTFNKSEFERAGVTLARF